MTAGWRTAVDRFWAAELGVEVGAFARAGLQVLERDADGVGARIVFVGTPVTTVVSITRGDRPRFEATGLRVEALGPSPRSAVAALADTPSLDVRGPAYLGCWTRPAAPPAPPDVRRLDPTTERAALAALRETASDEWEEAGLDAAAVLFGIREDDALVAVAGYERWASLAHLQVFTHPRARRRGLARAVLAAAIGHARAAWLLPQYRARDSNVASRAVAERMGFEEYGWMATIRPR
jgi:RimJ/RimL family protein N-acetyltransferase